MSYTPPGMAWSYAPTAAERQELQDLQDYLEGHAKAGTLGRLPEGSVAALLNKASPRVREHMLGSQDVVRNFRDSGGRELPFQPKKDISDLGLSDTIKQVMDKSDTEEVTHDLLSRMGTDTQDNSPPTTRDYLEAAFDHHEGSTND